MKRILPHPIRWLFLGPVATLILGLVFVQSVRSSPPATNSLPPDKAAMEQRIEQIRQQALSAPQRPKGPHAPPPSVPQPAWRSGIIDSGQSPFPGGLFAFENQWQELVDGRHVNVYAGSERLDPSQGLVIVQTMALDLHSFEQPVAYRTPVKSGSLHIVAADGLRLTLQSSNGTTVIFDVAARQFISL